MLRMSKHRKIVEEAREARREYAERLGKHSRRCTNCGGTGGIAYRGRLWSNDPQNWDMCAKCEGSGWER